jgi:hypothetical protein
MTAGTPSEAGRRDALAGRVRVVLGGLRRDAELRREADMMGFYLGVTLLVVLNLPPEEAPPPLRELLALIWGTTVGLALMHWMALALAAYLVRDPPLHHTPTQLLVAQVAMAAVIALAASVALLLAPRSVELVVTRVVVALCIGALVTVEARTNGGPLRRGLAVGAVAIVLAVGAATLKRLFM